MKNKRIYVFDWDDNIIHMPTTMIMEKLIGESWDIIEISSKDYAEIRKNPEYRYPIGVSDPYLNFSNNQQFITDLNKALNDKTYGPSFSKFKECLIYGNDFSIITARGQSIDVIRAGIIMIIGKTFLDYELNMMLENVGDLNNYLSKQIISPVTSSEMNFPQLKELGVVDSIELRKVLALDLYVEHRINVASEFEFDGKFSIGISDDDQRNINTIKDFINKALKPKYPNIHFVIYDTSNPNNIIKRAI